MWIIVKYNPLNLLMIHRGGNRVTDSLIKKVFTYCSSVWIEKISLGLFIINT